MMMECTVHLIALHTTTSLSTYIDQVSADTTILIRGIPHGWVHQPRKLHHSSLTGNGWDLFLLTRGLSDTPNPRSAELVSAHVSVAVLITDTQFAQLESRLGTRPRVSTGTPSLPAEWSHHAIPASSIVRPRNSTLRAGELRLDTNMATYLSNALPGQAATEPVCFFNLFKYLHGDRSTHDAYMQGFKDNFGSAAGASVLFMGPTERPLQFLGPKIGDIADGKSWDDANLVQYDSVWHYAYMLSTDVYKELNKQKVDGLEDTCIMLVSEIELCEDK